MKPSRLLLALIPLLTVVPSAPASAEGAGVVPAVGSLVTGPDGVGARVPEPGHWVTGVFDLVDGRSLSVFVETARDGSVFIGRRAPWARRSSPAAAAATPHPCSDPAHSFIGGRWNRALVYVYNPVGTTPTISQNQAAAAIRAGTDHIPTAYNDCGRGDAVSAESVYRGRDNTAVPSILGLFCFGLRDGKNAVAFVTPLPPPILAATCNFGVGHDIRESDIGIAANWPWYRKKPNPCVGGFDLEAVMIHERGHSWGLGHVSEGAHPLLTMSSATGACDGSASTLGLGDMLGLEALY
jgi:hypothetical protein